VTRRTPGDGGNAVTETVLVVPVLLLVGLFVVFVGRMTSTNHDIDGAARDAARAASIATTPDDAVAAAQATTTSTLAGRHVRCNQLAVDVDTTAFTAGGNVAVSVRCTVSLADVAGLLVPGSATLHAHAVEVVDRYRGGLP
jgi:Flp pilus assembly protein TadG